MDIKPYILIAEDDELNQIIFKEQLSFYFDIKIANDGKECLQFLENKTPAILLLDINMPDLNGYSVCEIIRKNPEYNKLPIIFVSALATEKERQLGLDAGGNDFLTKPYEEESLLKLIRKYI